MRRIALFAIVAALLAAPASAQDWERYYPLTETPGAVQVLTIDPSIPRGTEGRYKRVALADLLPASVRLMYLSSAERTHDAETDTSDILLTVAGVDEADVPFGSLLMFTTPPSIPPATGEIDVQLGTAAPLPLRDADGTAVRWSVLRMRGTHAHIVIRGNTAWSLVH